VFLASLRVWRYRVQFSILFSRNFEINLNKKLYFLNDMFVMIGTLCPSEKSYALNHTYSLRCVS
jgi:hypothetical protein